MSLRVRTTSRARRHLGGVGAAACVAAVLAAGCGSSSKPSSQASSTSAASTTAGSAATTGGSTTTGAAPAAGPGGNTAGLSATSITVGDVSTESGPIPGLFSGAPDGVDAYFAYINSQGGVNGRKLAQKVGDDAFNCQTDATQVRNLAPQVFAFVGSMSEDDGCGAKTLPPSIPAVYADQINVATEHLPNGFSPIPVQTGFQTGPELYLAKTNPQDVKSVGILYSSAAATNNASQENAMKSAGWKITYQRAIGPTETDFTSDILRMKSEGVRLFWMNATATVEADVAKQAAQQGWHPLFVLYNGYSHDLLKLAPASALEGIVNFAPSSLFLGEDESQIPADKLFLTWMAKTHPSFTPDLFSFFGWEAAELFVQGLRGAGAQPTRASVMASLKSIHSFTGDGLSAPADVGNDRPPICWLESTIHNGKWVRVTPQHGFQCSPAGFLPYNGH